MNEMAEIHRKVHGIETRRPMTHDIFAALMRAEELELASVEITELKDDVFYARMNFLGKGGRTFSLDARPSDAVAIATGVKTRLYASETILDEIGIVESDDPDAPDEEAAGGGAG
jgi:hypothetical protein